MNFWALASCKPDARALMFGADAASAGSMTYAELGRRADDFAGKIGGSDRKRLGAILCRNAPEAIIAYLAALRCGDAMMLLDGQTNPALLQAILERYQPEWMYQAMPQQDRQGYTGEHEDDRPDGWHLLRRANPGPTATPHPDLAVLLSTSGTTGSPRMVRLSHANIASNAKAIVEYLAIDSGVRVITTLPFNYSYGMSVVNSHLAAGATLVLTECGLTSREFWDTFNYHRVTSLPGVPYTYQMLHRLNPRKLQLDSLDTLTQAGGPLPRRLVDYFRELSDERGWRFFVMYGQTEAAPRISYVPPTMLASKAGSIGIAIPGGRLTLTESGELIFEGRNVMMGYAECRDDLAGGDELNGRLATGDLANVDADGYYFLRGRLKRFIKIHGNRISLDEIEQGLESRLNQPVAVVGRDDQLKVYLSAGANADAAKQLLTRSYHLHPATFSLVPVVALPYTASGKKDYSGLDTR
jgi:acyl-CoA synthetase (AMP-forming)/AMP-acid ligase II